MVLKCLKRFLNNALIFIHLPFVRDTSSSDDEASEDEEESSDDEEGTPKASKANDVKKAFGTVERPPFEAKDFRKKLFGRNGGTGMNLAIRSKRRY